MKPVAFLIQLCLLLALLAPPGLSVVFSDDSAAQIMTLDVCSHGDSAAPGGADTVSLHEQQPAGSFLLEFAGYVVPAAPFLLSSILVSTPEQPPEL